MPQAPVPRPTKRPTAERRARMATVLDLHSKGLTDRKIAEHLHISHTQVQRDRNRALEDITRPGAEQVFKVTSIRLEHLYGLAVAQP